MSKLVTEVVLEDVAGHPAINAWRKISPDYGFPVAVERLKVKKWTRAYRLREDSPSKFSVIAKWCLQSLAINEHKIYTQILPYISISAVQSFGMIDAEEQGFCWIFLEDAGEEYYSKLNAEQLRLASEWLGRLHVYSEKSDLAALLPDCGARRYLSHMSSARKNILNYLESSNLTEQHIVLKQILTQFDALESQWQDLESMSEIVGPTLIHGDFVTKNVFVRRDSKKVSILPLDWGESGWGSPTVDIHRSEIGAYLSTVRPFWPYINKRTLHRLAGVGAIFNNIAACNWESALLPGRWSGTKALQNLRGYEQRLATAMSQCGMKAWRCNGVR